MGNGYWQKTLRVNLTTKSTLSHLRILSFLQPVRFRDLRFRGEPNSVLQEFRRRQEHSPTPLPVPVGDLPLKMPAMTFLFLKAGRKNLFTSR